MAREGIGASLELTSRKPREWVQRVITLLDSAIGELNRDHSAKGTLVEAASLLRAQFAPEPATAGDEGRLLAWQARKVVEYIDAHIADSIMVADLCALIQRSEAHFSRSFKRTFAQSPHAFVIRRRLDLAAQYMLQTEAPLSDIALRCGFTDQAHFCKHFRQATGETPGAWRRVRRMQRFGSSTPDSSSEGVARESGAVERATAVAA